MWPNLRFCAFSVKQAKRSAMAAKSDFLIGIFKSDYLESFKGGGVDEGDLSVLPEPVEPLPPAAGLAAGL